MSFFFLSDLFVEGTSSKSIASSPNIDGYYPTSLPRTTCTFKIDTTKGYILELSFEKMSISSCSKCSCGYVKVRDGSSLTAQLLGTYCSENYHDEVTTKGNHMFVEYYASRRSDTFKATISSKKGTNLLITTVHVRLVQGNENCTIHQSSAIADDSLLSFPVLCLAQPIQIFFTGI